LDSKRHGSFLAYTAFPVNKISEVNTVNDFQRIHDSISMMAFRYFPQAQPSDFPACLRHAPKQSRIDSVEKEVRE
jgi:hypothetical protein